MMVSRYAKKLISLLAILPAFFLSLPARAQSQGTYDFVNQSGLNVTGSQAGYSDALKALSPTYLGSKAIGIILSILGVIFIALIIYGGVTWMIAEGNEQKVEKAKQIIIASIVGLVVVLAAYAASYFIISYFSAKTLN